MLFCPAVLSLPSTSPCTCADSCLVTLRARARHRVAAGRAGWLTWVQIGLNFVVPFLVSSYGYLAAASVLRPAPLRAILRALMTPSTRTGQAEWLGR